MSKFSNNLQDEQGASPLENLNNSTRVELKEPHQNYHEDTKRTKLRKSLSSSRYTSLRSAIVNCKMKITK